MKKKDVDDVMGGEDAWKNADKNESKFALAASFVGRGTRSKTSGYLAYGSQHRVNEKDALGPRPSSIKSRFEALMNQ